jgi:hypothetical protein
MWLSQEIPTAVNLTAATDNIFKGEQVGSVMLASNFLLSVEEMERHAESVVGRGARCRAEESRDAKPRSKGIFPVRSMNLIASQ